MALYNSIISCTAMFTLPLGAWFVPQGWSTLPDLVLALCMSFGIGAPLLRPLSFLSTMPQVNFTIEALEQMMSAPPLKQAERPFTGKDHSSSFENVRFGYKEEEVLHGVSLSAREWRSLRLSRPKIGQSAWLPWISRRRTAPPAR